MKWCITQRGPYVAHEMMLSPGPRHICLDLPLTSNTISHILYLQSRTSPIPVIARVQHHPSHLLPLGAILHLPSWTHHHPTSASVQYLATRALHLAHPTATQSSHLALGSRCTANIRYCVLSGSSTTLPCSLCPIRPFLTLPVVLVSRVDHSTRSLTPVSNHCTGFGLAKRDSPASSQDTSTPPLHRRRLNLFSLPFLQPALLYPLYLYFCLFFNLDIAQR